MNIERQLDRFWDRLLLLVLNGSLVAAVASYLLPDSVFPGGAEMREGMVAASAFLFGLLCFYLAATGVLREMFRVLKKGLQRRRKRHYPQTEEERAYAEYRYAVLPDIPPALLRKRMSAWMKNNEEDGVDTEIWEDTAEHYVLHGEDGDDCYGMDAAFSGEDYVLALSFLSAENDYTHAEQKRLIPASLHRAWKKMLMPWGPFDIPVNALIIRHGGETRLYPKGAEGNVRQIVDLSG